jgi:hypothetical protein
MLKTIYAKEDTKIKSKTRDIIGKIGILIVHSTQNKINYAPSHTTTIHKFYFFRDADGDYG